MEVLIFIGRVLLERSLEDDYFDDGSDTLAVGYFWGVLEMRPCMRVQQALVPIQKT